MQQAAPPAGDFSFAGHLFGFPEAPGFAHPTRRAPTEWQKAFLKTCGPQVLLLLHQSCRAGTVLIQRQAKVAKCTVNVNEPKVFHILRAVANLAALRRPQTLNLRLVSKPVIGTDDGVPPGPPPALPDNWSVHLTHLLIDVPSSSPTLPLIVSTLSSVTRLILVDSLRYEWLVLLAAYLPRLRAVSVENLEVRTSAAALWECQWEHLIVRGGTEGDITCMRRLARMPLPSNNRPLTVYLPQTHYAGFYVLNEGLPEPVIAKLPRWVFKSIGRGIVLVAHPDTDPLYHYTALERALPPITTTLTCPPNTPLTLKHWSLTPAIFSLIAATLKVPVKITDCTWGLPVAETITCSVPCLRTLYCKDQPLTDDMVRVLTTKCPGVTDLWVADVCLTTWHVKSAVGQLQRLIVEKDGLQLQKQLEKLPSSRWAPYVVVDKTHSVVAVVLPLVVMTSTQVPRDITAVPKLPFATPPGARQPPTMLRVVAAPSLSVKDQPTALSNALKWAASPHGLAPSHVYLENFTITPPLERLLGDVADKWPDTRVTMPRTKCTPRGFALFTNLPRFLHLELLGTRDVGPGANMGAREMGSPPPAHQAHAASASKAEGSEGLGVVSVREVLALIRHVGVGLSVVLRDCVLVFDLESEQELVHTVRYYNEETKEWKRVSVKLSPLIVRLSKPGHVTYRLQPPYPNMSPAAQARAMHANALALSHYFTPPDILHYTGWTVTHDVVHAMPSVQPRKHVYISGDMTWPPEHHPHTAALCQQLGAKLLTPPEVSWVVSDKIGVVPLAHMILGRGPVAEGAVHVLTEDPMFVPLVDAEVIMHLWSEEEYNVRVYAWADMSGDEPVPTQPLVLLTEPAAGAASAAGQPAGTAAAGMDAHDGVAVNWAEPAGSAEHKMAVCAPGMGGSGLQAIAGAVAPMGSGTHTDRSSASDHSHISTDTGLVGTASVMAGRHSNSNEQVASGMQAAREQPAPPLQPQPQAQPLHVATPPTAPSPFATAIIAAQVAKQSMPAGLAAAVAAQADGGWPAQQAAGSSTTRQRVISDGGVDAVALQADLAVFAAQQLPDEAALAVHTAETAAAAQLTMSPLQPGSPLVAGQLQPAVTMSPVKWCVGASIPITPASVGTPASLGHSPAAQRLQRMTAARQVKQMPAAAGQLPPLSVTAQLQLAAQWLQAMQAQSPAQLQAQPPAQLLSPTKHAPAMGPGASL